MVAVPSANFGETWWMVKTLKVQPIGSANPFSPDIKQI